MIVREWLDFIAAILVILAPLPWIAVNLVCGACLAVCVFYAFRGLRRALLLTAEWMNRRD
jgi:hypothetical protein